MRTILEIINKIKWDKSENPEEYIFAYEDRVEHKLKEIKFTDIIRMEGNFMVLQHDDEEVEVPLHRIREVRKKGIVVWKR